MILKHFNNCEAPISIYNEVVLRNDCIDGDNVHVILSSRFKCSDLMDLEVIIRLSLII